MIERFLSSKTFAVVGASVDRSKFGNKVLRKYVEKGKKVFPVHPKQTEIEGIEVKQLSTIAEENKDNLHTVGVSIVTPPNVSLKVLKEAKDLGFSNLWLQPGAESKEVLDFATEQGLEVIAGGPCVLVELSKL